MMKDKSSAIKTLKYVDYNFKVSIENIIKTVGKAPCLCLKYFIPRFEVQFLLLKKCITYENFVSFSYMELFTKTIC